VCTWIDQLRGELIQAMILTATTDVASVDRGILYEVPRT
jgi:hypothetical protein